MRSNPLKIGIIGAAGRFGKTLATRALKDPAFHLFAALVHPDSPSVGQDLGSLLGMAPIDLIASSEGPEPAVWIDVSLPKALSRNLERALSAKTPIVIGTTGLSSSDFQFIEEAARQIPIFYAPNFSLGMAILRKVTAEIASRFHSNASIDIVETHHEQKKDAPSGAALLLAKEVQEFHPQKKHPSIHSIRSAQVIGEHTLLFNSAEEKLTISHEAHTRETFARGALEAALFLSRKLPGLYGMDDLLDEKSKTRDH